MNLMRNSLKGVATVALASLALAGVPRLASAESGPGFDDPNNWPQYHRSYNAWRFSPLDQINKSNVNKLKVAWIMQPGNITHGLQATPIEIDGVMYLISADNHVWALNATSGEKIWDFQPKLDPVVNEVFYRSASRGVTVGRGKVFIGTLDGRFIALDQKTGKQLWSTQLTKPKEEWGALFSAPPQLAGDVVFGGTTGGDQPGTGKIYAVKADTGERAWTFEVPKNDPKSWPGESRKHAGTSAWMPGTYDPTTDTIYIGTGNASPDYYTGDREGDNLYASSLLALNPKDGSVKWYRQEVPNDAWDFDSAYEALLIPHDGKTVLVHLNKNGYVYVMNKDNGSMLNAWQYGENVNWTTGVDPKTGLPGPENRPEVGKQKLFCPNLLGSRSWNAGAYNPKSGLWYGHGMEVCNTVTGAKQSYDEVPINSLTLGLSEITLVDPPGKTADGWLKAFDPFTGKIKWAHRYDLPPLSNVLTTGGGLVITGDMHGKLYAYDADDGKELWSFSAGSGARGGPISYMVNGKQYIVIPTGLGSHAPGFLAGRFPEIKNLPGGAALIAFTLD
jgi:alcohol dehydrogenase (cytochrome c)